MIIIPFEKPDQIPIWWTKCKKSCRWKRNKRNQNLAQQRDQQELNGTRVTKTDLQTIFYVCMFNEWHLNCPYTASEAMLGKSWFECSWNAWKSVSRNVSFQHTQRAKRTEIWIRRDQRTWDKNKIYFRFIFLFDYKTHNSLHQYYFEQQLARLNWMKALLCLMQSSLNTFLKMFRSSSLFVSFIE